MPLLPFSRILNECPASQQLAVALLTFPCYIYLSIYPSIHFFTLALVNILERHSRDIPDNTIIPPFFHERVGDRNKRSGKEWRRALVIRRGLSQHRKSDRFGRFVSMSTDFSLFPISFLYAMIYA